MRSLITIPILIVVLAAGISAQRGKPKESEVLGHTMYTMLKPGDIPAVFEPTYISVDKAKQVYYDDEPLMVVTVDGDTRAFSTWHLDHHEVVNDYIGGIALAVTW